MRGLFLIVLFSQLYSTFASPGDRSHSFNRCLSQCKTFKCENSTPAVLPLALRITRWTCLDDCKYSCMQEITSVSIKNGGRIVQYYGKWPFWRLAGMQEPASVTFSLLNLWAHLSGVLRIKREVPSWNPMRTYLLVWSSVSINTWVWSAIFHTRDTPTTEKLDYFSAALTILVSLYFTAIRVFHLYASPISQNTSLRIWSLLCTVAFIGHVSYLMLLPRFDYQYNIVFNLVIGLTHNALWLIFSLPASLSLVRRYPSQPKTYRPAFVGRAALLVALTTAATALELFDFPPWAGIIDAHALWHLSTAPIAVLWYRFLIQDASDASWKDRR